MPGVDETPGHSRRHPACNNQRTADRLRRWARATGAARGARAAAGRKTPENKRGRRAKASALKHGECAGRGTSREHTTSGSWARGSDVVAAASFGTRSNYRHPVTNHTIQTYLGKPEGRMRGLPWCWFASYSVPRGMRNTDRTASSRNSEARTSVRHRPPTSARFQRAEALEARSRGRGGRRRGRAVGGSCWPRQSAAFQWRVARRALVVVTAAEATTMQRWSKARVACCRACTTQRQAPVWCWRGHGRRRHSRWPLAAGAEIRSEPNPIHCG